MKDKILVIEDDKNINDMLTQLLSTNGYEVVNAYSGTEGVLLHGSTVRLILLDLMLPGKTGEEIIGDLKQKADVPIMVMSAITDTMKKVDLLELGADDYITKPFDNKELLVRVKVQLRHRDSNPKQDILKYKDIEMNIVTHTVYCNHQEVIFTKNEFELLKTLMEYPNQVLPKSMLFDSVWGDEDSADDNTLNVHISKIRNKLKECNPKEIYIETIWSIGYKMKK